MKNLKFPANSMFITEFIIQIANFELIEVEGNYKLPEEDPYNLSFSQCGYESIFFVSNMGFPQYIIFAHFALAAFFIVLYLITLVIPKLKRFTNYLSSYLFWNGFIRLYIELY